MLKGHVFEKQVFGNQIFALFINTFLNGINGVSDNYKNGMAVTYSGNSVTVQSGAVIIQGRPLEEDSNTSITAGTDTAYCKLVIEVDLDKQNTESDFLQGEYKIVKSTTGYPTLTQNNIVKNNSGIYQYELARFRTGTNGITEFSDRRTFLDFDSIYTEIKQHIQNIDDGSLFVQKSSVVTLTGTLEGNGTSKVIGSALYPEGFTKDNCIIIGYALKAATKDNWMIGSTFDSGNSFGSLPFRIIMNDAGISMEFKNIAINDGVTPTFVEMSINYDYKIVIMKIA